MIPIEKSNKIEPVENKQVLLGFHNVEKIYKLGTQEVHALRGINLSIYAGDFVAIVGPSGSGKSTFLNLASLIDKPSKGLIEYEGTDIASFSDNEITKFRNKKIGIVFQNYNLIPVMDAVENVAFSLQVQGVAVKESKEKAKELLDKVGLGSHLTHLPGNLSGGQRQRVAIARAIVTNPEIVIADEPTAALDGKTGAEIIRLMRQLNESLQTTFLFSTHDNRIMDQVNHIIEMEDGLLKQ